jgi:hypothetical protein
MAPEKVYIDDYGSGFSHGWHTEHSYEKDIEYIRKDAFIEKVLKFLDENFFFDNRRNSIESGVFDSKEEMIEDFKKYMKGE